MDGPDFNYFSGISLFIIGPDWLPLFRDLSFYTTPTPKQKFWIFCFGVGVACIGRQTPIHHLTWLPLFRDLSFYTTPTPKQKMKIFCFGVGVVCIGSQSPIHGWTWLQLFFRHFLLYYPNAEAKNLYFLLRHWGSMYREAVLYSWLDLTSNILQSFPSILPQRRSKKS